MADKPTESAAPAADQKGETKEFSLKPIQQQMLQVLQDQYFGTLSNFLSFLALEFWGYTVTPNTKFEVRDGKVFISEGTPPPDAPTADVATANGPAPQAGPAQPIAAQPETVNPQGAKADEPSIA